ncbi:MAG: hypothetical protein M3N54_16255, partial [Acidobacteriota bacterium]|nr:hypothetical protein [Acidobacteriota bacterium]
PAEDFLSDDGVSDYRGPDDTDFHGRYELLSRRARNGLRLAAMAGLVASCAFGVALVANQLIVHLDGDYLRVTVPRLNFLSGKPLERLKDGATVAFIGQLSISQAPNAVVADARYVARFALSYDIWEQQFSVTKIGERPESRRSVSHLSAQATENWCLDNLTIDRSQLPADKPFYVQLDLRSEDPRDTLGIIGDPGGINITRLIEMFSRPARSAQPRWLLNNGPFRLSELRKGIHG